jgi:ATP sulfurylase
MNHPGIINLKSRGDFFISGQIFKLIKNEIELSSLEGHPKKIKELIYSKGWHNVVGFHSRNIPHNGHIFLQKYAMKQANADGLLISPIIGNKRKGDFANKFLKESYKHLLQKNYYKENSILSFLDIYPRYAGPREAIFTAQCRKNFGCTHFIIGRDHCGVEDYYNKKSNKLFYKQIKNLDIELIFFEDIGYDFKKKKFIISNSNTRPISGSILRDCIKTKKNIPKYLVDSSQIDLIKKWKEKFFV